MLREHGIAFGHQLIISTAMPATGHVKIICSSDQMLLKCLPQVSEAMLQWLAIAHDDLVLEDEKDTDRHIIVSYEGAISDFVHRLGNPIYVQTTAAHTANKEKALPLPAQFEQALETLIGRKRRLIVLNERGSFKIVKKA